MPYVPTANELVEYVVAPLFSGEVPSAVPLAKKVTDPVGAVMPFGSITVAVNVNEAPTVATFAGTARVTVATGAASVPDTATVCVVAPAFRELVVIATFSVSSVD